MNSADFPKPVNMSRVLDANTVRLLSSKYKPLCGIYFLLLRNKVKYVGQSTHMQYRISQHAINKNGSWDRVAYIECEPDKRLALEAAYIKKLCPEWNIMRPQTWPSPEEVRNARNAAIKQANEARKMRKKKRDEYYSAAKAQVSNVLSREVE